MQATDAGGQDGFTLLETLVAFLILSATLTVAIQSISQTGDFAVRSQLNAELRSKGRQLLAELEPTAKSATKLDGVINDRFAWSWTVERYGSEKNLGLLRYVLTMRSAKRPNAAVTFSGLVQSNDPPAN